MTRLYGRLSRLLLVVSMLYVRSTAALPSSKLASQDDVIFEIEQQQQPQQQHDSSMDHVLHDEPGDDALRQVVAKLEYAGVIPTVLRSFSPSFFLNVSWPTKPHLSADLGNLLDPKKLIHSPLFTVSNPRHSLPPSPLSTQGPGAPYRHHLLLQQQQQHHLHHRLPPVNNIVTLSDPDAPSWYDPKWSEVCHQILYVRRGADDNDSSGGDDAAANVTELVPYKAPAPPPRTGRHRYVFVLWAPANGTREVLNLTRPAERRHWGYGGGGGGGGGDSGSPKREGVWRWAGENGLEAVAANFFYAQHRRQ